MVQEHDTMHSFALHGLIPRPRNPLDVQEILMAIASHVMHDNIFDDRLLFVPLFRVNSTFHAAFRPAFWSSVEVVARQGQDLPFPFCALEANRHLVHSLTMGGPLFVNWSSLYFPRLTRLHLCRANSTMYLHWINRLNGFPAKLIQGHGTTLQELVLTHLEPTDDAVHFWHVIGELPCLSRLSVTGMDVHTTTAFLEVLEKCPLQDLSLKHVSLGHLYSEGSYQLHELHQLHEQHQLHEPHQLQQQQQQQQQQRTYPLLSATILHVTGNRLVLMRLYRILRASPMLRSLVSDSGLDVTHFFQSSHPLSSSHPPPLPAFSS